MIVGFTLTGLQRPSLPSLPLPLEDAGFVAAGVMARRVFHVTGAEAAQVWAAH